MNTELKKSKNNFVEVLFKFVNDAALAKTMKNMRKD